MTRKRITMKSTLCSTAIVAALAGLPASTAIAGGPPSPSSEADHATQGDLKLVSVDTLRGTTVKNANGQTLGTIDDMIVRRGSGEITHIILTTDTVLGMGGREVAAPYASFGFDPEQERFTLHATPEQIEKLMTFSPDDRKGLVHKNLSEKASALAERISREIEVETTDPYAESVRRSEVRGYAGEITEVDRGYTTAGEFVTIHVATSNGEFPIVLGPSWYVMSGKSAPMRGDQVEGDAFDIRGKQLVAKDFTLQGMTTTLRSDRGQPYWAPSLSESEKKNKQANVGRFVLMSDLTGRSVDCRGIDCGEIADVVLERASGRIAFLSIDPDQNFLGIGDTTRLVPWSIANVPIEGDVRVDASKGMVLGSAETPGDVSMLDKSSNNSRIFAAFHVDRPEFTPVERHTGALRNGLGGWESDGDFAHAVRNGKAHTFKGEVTAIINRKPCESVSTGRALVVRTPDGASKTVFVGPIWHTQTGLMDLAKGDTITVNTRMIEMDGDKCLVAESLLTDQGRIALWEDGPAWDIR